MKKQLIIGIILIVVGLSTFLPAGATQPELRNVELYLWGGIGVHAGVYNEGEKTINAKLEITSQYFNTVTHFPVPPKTRTPVTLYQVAFYRPINVTLSVGTQQLTKTGFVVGIFVFIA